MSQVSGLQTVDMGSLIEKAIGECPQISVLLGGQEVCCLIDTGAQVSTITESFFRQHFQKKSLVDVSTCIRITGSYGMDIPYLGYIELILTVEGEQFHNMGFLVVRDPIDQDMKQRKLRVPGVIGSNVLRDIQKHLHQRGSGKIKNSPVLGPILALFEEARVKSSEVSTGRVRIASKKPVLIPGRSLRVVEATVRPADTGQVYHAVIEES